MDNITVTLPHLTLSGLQLGNPVKPKVLCLHGWLDNAASFAPLFEELSATHHPLLDAYHFIALDWPGHGLSSHRGDDNYYHFVDYVDDLYQVLTALSDEQVSIIGHSMGGMVASLFTAAFANKVSNLILIEALGLLTEDEDPAALLQRGVLSRQAQRQKQSGIHKTIDDAVLARVRVSDLDEINARTIVRRSLEAVSGGYRWRSDPRLRTVSLMRMGIHQAIKVMHSISANVTLIRGDTGFNSIKSAVDVFATHIGHFQQHTINGGHHCHMQSVKSLVNVLENTLEHPPKMR
ncbi:alpha/beta fold hydrolase [Thalassotalea maritima]|uniref:alpha/beta fold hydrolase n=1 Tax=Thalassotalea maritima TaxID=3242416 RepID=UPI00352919CF